MDIVTIDFETYYDKDFSLKTMTTEAYIRDPRFEVIGVGVKVNDGPTDWYSGTGVDRFLRSLDYSKCAVLCHNTVFDGAILSWHYNIKPKLWLDTLSMARPLHNLSVGGSLALLAKHYNLGEKGTAVLDAIGKHRTDFTNAELAAYGEYCIQDVELTYALFHILKTTFPVKELMVIDQTIRMFTEPTVQLDTTVLQNHYNEVVEAKNKLLDSFGVSREEARSLIMSNKKFADLLESAGVEVPMKVSPRTGKLTYAFAKTDKGMTNLLVHPMPLVQTLATVRLGAKSTIEETRALSLLGIAERGDLPIMLNYYGAHTGRFSGGDKVNLQNFPKRANTTMRRGVCAPEGHYLVACDLAQIEARLVAWLAGQDELVQAFREGRDVYSEFASKVYGRTITKEDKVERFVGKTCILGLGYGMGAAKFKDTLALGQAGISVDIELHEAERIVRLYRQENHKIVQLWQRCGYVLNAIMQGATGDIGPSVTYDGRGIRLPNGFYVQYPHLKAVGSQFVYLNDARAVRKHNAGEHLSSSSWTKLFGGKVTENIVQALAAIIIRHQMVDIGLLYKAVFQVHDEIVACVKTEEIETASVRIAALMSTPPKWAPDLPVACELSYASNYGDV